MNINLLLSVIAIIWTLLLTIFTFWLYKSLKNLFKDSTDKNFIKAFRRIEEIQQNNLKDILNLNLNLDSFKKDSKFNIQKVKYVKYNPFKETGGNNSFSLVLLDGNKNGIIITSLHTRERTRLYLKEIALGESKIELSEDEEKVLKESLR